ncbi:cytochrome P450 2G1-like [Cuculus canorus]|uniref:cytochrome P450 2G1-like n=1 Tax=Cuculus canorus TaxID=55661 RepID=UPI0023AACD98|nr:cytochrome P450 2G1-like [Cuculus canorus]
MEPFTASILVLLGLLGLGLLLRGQRGPRGQRGQLPPGPRPLPLVGNLLHISPWRTLRALLQLSRTYGPVFTIYLGTRPVVVLCGHDVLREALVDNAEAFAGRGRMPTVESTFHGHGVVFANGSRWRTLRRFSLTVLRDFGMGRKSLEERIREEAQFLLRELRSTHQKPFDPTFFLSCAVSNVICSIVFGNRFDYRDKEFLELLRLMNESFTEISTASAQLYDMAEPLLRFAPGRHRRIPLLLRRLRAFIARRVDRNSRDIDRQSPRDFIDSFLIQMEAEKSDPNSEFNRENLELTTLNLFFAGTETVSSTLRFGFLLLMRHPDVLAKVVSEIDEVLGRDRIPSAADRRQMPYTDAVLHEIQRCSDLLPLNVPHRVTRDIVFRGFFIPKDTDVYPLLSPSLHDPSHFKNPQNFDPQNFLDESGNFRRNEAFVPFSAGKRVCLGESLAKLELFIFLTSILQHLELQPLCPPSELPTTPQESGFGNIPPQYQLIVRPR